MKKYFKPSDKLELVAKLTYDILEAKKIIPEIVKECDEKGKYHSRFIIHCMDIKDVTHWAKEIK